VTAHWRFGKVTGGQKQLDTGTVNALDNNKRYSIYGEI
jgi:hypothetical protein